MKIDFARNIALNCLYKIDEENGYSNIVLDEYLNRYREKLNKKDINLISEIVYGTITWKLTIDFILQKYSKTKLKKMSKWILNILRMGAYQIIFLDKIPKSAAVNESVNLTKKYAFKSSSLVNAILRKIDKQDYEELDDRYKRILAEFENFKKRSSKEREGLYNSILSDVIEVILPVVDNLENAAKVETQDEEYKKGVELVLKQLKDVLNSKGVEEIKTVGETFDPELHEAVSSIQDENLGEKEIAQEYRKGYKIGNRVIRHSMVVVAN